MVPASHRLRLAVIHQTVWKIAASVGAAPHRAGAVVHLLKAPVELARLTGVPAPSRKTVHALIDLLTRA